MLFLNGIVLIAMVVSGLALMLGAHQLALRLFVGAFLLAFIAPALERLFGVGQ